MAEKEKTLFFEVSAKSGAGVDNMMYNCIAKLSFFQEFKVENEEKLIKDLIESNSKGGNDAKMNNADMAKNFVVQADENSSNFRLNNPINNKNEEKEKKKEEEIKKADNLSDKLKLFNSTSENFEKAKEKKEEQLNIKKEKSEQIKPINNIADKIKMMSGTGQENLKKEEKLKSKDMGYSRPRKISFINNHVL